MERSLHTLFIVLVLATFYPEAYSQPQQPSMPMSQIAESYVKLVLAVGEHDENYVDAYYGPEEWRTEAKNNRKSLADIRQEAEGLLANLEQIGMISRFDEMGYLRHQYLTKQLASLKSRVEMLEGKRFSFDAESEALYDAVAPVYNESQLKEALAELDKVLPKEEAGSTLQQRYEAFRSAFIIPKDKLDPVFKAAIDECRSRTKKQIALPENESFTVEYVTGKPWSAYNWYKGNSHSLIQVNTDLPISIDRAIDLAAHEGYPGHHVYNALLEENFLKKQGWVEFSVYPLFSPQSLIAEGSANYGIDVAFSREERIAFERDVLFPLAGLDRSQTEQYYRVFGLTEKLAYADNEAARKYSDGEISREDAVKWMMEYRLMTRERAEQRVRFIETYRSYVINYNLGKDLVRNFIESRGGAATNQQKRWEEFGKLLSSPRLPSGLK